MQKNNELNIRSEKGEVVDIIRYACNHRKPTTTKMYVDGKETVKLPKDKVESEPKNIHKLAEKILGQFAENAEYRVLHAKYVFKDGVRIDTGGYPTHVLFVTNVNKLHAFGGAHNHDIINVNDEYYFVAIPLERARQTISNKFLQ